MLVVSELFISHLSREIVRIENAGKVAAIGKRKSRAVIGWKRIDERASFIYKLSFENGFFLSAEGGVRSFDKSDIIEKNKIRNQFFEKLFLLSFHLSAFEVTFIKTSNPTLCRQKEFVLNLK